MTDASARPYNSISKSFHWLVVAMVAVQFTVGWLMPGVRRGMTPAGLVSFHMSFGVVILAIIALRFAWRLAVTPPPSLSASRAESSAAVAAHYLLYASLVVLPLTGWALASAHGWAVSAFGLATLHPLVAPSFAAVRLYDFLHVATAIGVLMLIGLHTLAALYHHFLRKDETLNRMLPAWARLPYTRL